MRTFEWIIAAVSSLAVTMLLAFLIYEGVWGGREEVSLMVSQSAAVTSPDGHHLNVRVENLGGRTASAVEIIGELRQDQAVIETSRFVVDYVPGHSHRGGTLLFQRDPNEYELEVRVAGFAAP